MKSVEALREIAKVLNKTNWDFSVDPCSGTSSWIQPLTNKDDNNTVTCNCRTVCHVVSIGLKRQNLSGALPAALTKLPNLEDIDLTRNYLNGTLPTQWGTMPSLMTISVLGNHLSGLIPTEFGNITTLTSLVLEDNQFSGGLPPELGNLAKLERFIVPSNEFSGKLPETFAKLTNLKDFRISGNRFTGKIPDFIQNWAQLERLDLQSCGLEGPIPSGISHLDKMLILIISDLNGPESSFPQLSNMSKMQILILRNCNLSGEIAAYIGGMKELYTLDLSFNKLEGSIPSTFKNLGMMEFMFFTSNLLAGSVPQWMLDKGANIDLSYNNFMWGSRGSSECPSTDVNLFGSSSAGNTTAGSFPCSKNNYHCSRYYYSLHINCGGDQVVINGNTTYEKDLEVSGVAKFVLSSGGNWALSSTGNFINGKYFDDYIAANKSKLSMPNSELYTRGRLSAISLTYYGLCLLNGNYTVKVHFAEIIFTDDKTFSSLGRRIFDVYIQGKLVLKDFNIKEEAGGVGHAVVKNFTVPVTSNTLEIRLYWAGKGTKSIPDRGTYGPLISAISVDPDILPPKGGRATSMGAVIGITAAILFLISLVVGILWKKCCLGGKMRDRDLTGLELQTGSFTLKQINAATDNFANCNKIGEGGFGSVYKGLLPDGTVIAVKRLSSKSSQGNREFLNEIGIISALRHPNLVKLYGCCIEGDQLFLVYEYMENNSLAHALFSLEKFQLHLDWPTRHKICIGIARGLAFLHDECRLKIVHRDIKATNILLDRDLCPKISDFGLAKLSEGEKTHISTRIAGTLGYMAPEYAMHGHLTNKADVYSFGIVALEIVRGKSIKNFIPEGDFINLVDWVHILKEKGALLELVDPKLGSEFNTEEVLLTINVALLCTNASPMHRPTMSAVISMLEGRTAIQSSILIPISSSYGLEFKASGNHYHQSPSQTSSTGSSQTLILSVDLGGISSSSSASADNLNQTE